ncbi:hypothetical protein FRB95_000477 [Tulasnella sp. JGI-2019a]|nr:hypothetical protein FRB95_000477 [Tulasnella sp. JGI-2019a]
MTDQVTSGVAAATDTLDIAGTITTMVTDTIIATGIAITIAPAGIGSAYHATDIPVTMMEAMEMAKTVQVVTTVETAVDLPRVVVVENDSTTVAN